MTPACSHDGAATGRSRLDHEAKRVVYELVCGRCGDRIGEHGRVDYRCSPKWDEPAEAVAA